MKARTTFIALAALIPLSTAGCLHMPSETACTMELRINFCVTIDGSKEIPDSLRIIRTRANGYKDTLEADRDNHFGNCLSESSGRHTLQVYRDTTMLREIKDINIRKVDGCHASDTLIDIQL